MQHEGPSSVPHKFCPKSSLLALSLYTPSTTIRHPERMHGLEVHCQRLSSVLTSLAQALRTGAATLARANLVARPSLLSTKSVRGTQIRRER